MLFFPVIETNDIVKKIQVPWLIWSIDEENSLSHLKQICQVALEKGYNTLVLKKYTPEKITFIKNTGLKVIIRPEPFLFSPFLENYEKQLTEYLAPLKQLQNLIDGIYWESGLFLENYRKELRTKALLRVELFLEELKLLESHFPKTAIIYSLIDPLLALNDYSLKKIFQSIKTQVFFLVRNFIDLSQDFNQLIFYFKPTEFFPIKEPWVFFYLYHLEEQNELLTNANHFLLEQKENVNFLIGQQKIGSLLKKEFKELFEKIWPAIKYQKDKISLLYQFLTFNRTISLDHLRFIGESLKQEITYLEKIWSYEKTQNYKQEEQEYLNFWLNFLEELKSLIKQAFEKANLPYGFY